MRRSLALAEAAAALVLAQLAVRLVPFRWLVSSFEEPATLPSDSADAEPRIRNMGRTVGSAADRLPWRSTCLVRALATRLVLARMGIPSVLCLGVTTDDGTIRAHAWLLADGGFVCGGREAQGYTPIAAITSGRTA